MSCLKEQHCNYCNSTAILFFAALQSTTAIPTPPFRGGVRENCSCSATPTPKPRLQLQLQWMEAA